MHLLGFLDSIILYRPVYRAVPLPGFELLPSLELPCRSTHPFIHEPDIIRLCASLHIR